MSYLNDPRENRYDYASGCTCGSANWMEEDNRHEEKWRWGAMIVDFCDLPAEDYAKTIFTVSESTTKPKYQIQFTYYDASGNPVTTSVSTTEGKKPSAPSVSAYSVLTDGGKEKTTYMFKAWDPEVTAASSTTVYTAVYSEQKSYQITFNNDNGDELQQGFVNSGSTPLYTSSEPEKEHTAEYDYMFSAWTPDIVSATTPATYTATFTSKPRLYSVHFIKHGSTTTKDGILYSAITDTISAETVDDYEEDEVVYRMSGISETMDSASTKGSVSATVIYEDYKYRATFYNGKNSLQSNVYETGENVKYAGETPTSGAAGQYEFIGFNNGYDNINSAYTMQEEPEHFMAEYNTIKYKIDFMNEDVLHASAMTEYGVMPNSGATPVKEQTVASAFTFAGWDAEVVKVTENATYNALFNSSIRKYKVELVGKTDNVDSITVNGNLYDAEETYEYGSNLNFVFNASNEYHFGDNNKTTSSSTTITIGSENKIVVPETNINAYLVTLSGSMENIASSNIMVGNKVYDDDTEYEYGSAITASFTAATGYHFIDDDPKTEDNAVSAITITDTVHNGVVINIPVPVVLSEYTLSFFKPAATEAFTAFTAVYGKSGLAWPAIPEEVSESSVTKYSFAKYGETIPTVKEDADYTAESASTERIYSVTVNYFKSGTEYSAKTSSVVTDVEYHNIDEVITAYTGTVETSAATYTYTGATKTIDSAKSAATITLNYKEDKHMYTATFVNDDGTEISALTAEYGKDVQYTGAKPISVLSSDEFSCWTDDDSKDTFRLDENIVLKGDRKLIATYNSLIKYGVLSLNELNNLLKNN